MSLPPTDANAIVREALELPKGPERTTYLDRACQGDTTLRLQVESLLNAQDGAKGLLVSTAGNQGEGPVDTGRTREAPASAPGAPADPTPDSDIGLTTGFQRPVATEVPGTTIGPYKLGQKLGEGGMGTVFEAEQEHPVRRRVALKVIKPGMDTGQVVARFEAERQALALMDHPNIARVLDAGATDTGLPFFVMELVKGVQITSYCDQNHFTPKERLELFIPVCLAIQHAHQKGIVHRDIKPSNVLVTIHDGKPVPKVIDFGVAKAIDQRLTDKTMFTEVGAIIGTLEYMSPEQAEMGALDIDTRSDIYSLGVLLYELLTGSTPLERAKIRRAAFVEVLRRIREEEPTKPSTRLSESKDSLSTISARRKMEPARLMRLVRGDLDWIVMKSLEKDRARRYETANGFARDIQRYLDGDPVEACPPSASYKLGKFARKHRVALTTAGAFALLLVSATAVSAGLAFWANRERARALDREQMAIDAVKRYGEVVRETLELKNNPRLAGLRGTLLREPQAFFKKLRDRLQADQDTAPDSLARLATASYDLASLTDEIGDKQDALRAYQESLAILEHLARENPLSTKFQSDLAAIHNNIGTLQSDTGLTREALVSYEQALAIYERLTRENPSTPKFQNDLAKTHLNIGTLLRDTGHLAEALAAFEQARTLRERLAAENPTVTEYQNRLARTYNNIGSMHREADRAVEALASYKQARAIHERLTRENPSVTQYQNDLASIHNNIGLLQIATDHPVEALASYEAARTIQERLTSENPTVIEFQSDLASSHYNIGLLQSDTNHPVEALASYEQARKIQERLRRENPTVIQFQNSLANTYINIGTLKTDSGHPAEAMESFQEGRMILERLVSDHSDSPVYASGLGATLHNMSTIDLNEGRFDDARDKLTQAVKWQRKALATNASHPTYREFLALHLKDLIQATKSLGRGVEANRVRGELEELVASNPSKAALDARLTALIQGKEAPKDSADQILLAGRASEKLLHAASPRHYADAITKDPKLADDRENQYRYQAACAAALAATGQGKDVPPPGDAAKVGLRRQAREWLQAELAVWNRMAKETIPDNRARVVKSLKRWKADSDLAGIRDEKELAKLPEEERNAFQRLWNDVNRLLTEAERR